MKLLNTKEAAQAVKEGETITIESSHNGVHRIDLSLKDFDLWIHLGGTIQKFLETLELAKIYSRKELNDVNEDVFTLNRIYAKYQVALRSLSERHPEGLYLRESDDIEEMPSVLYYNRLGEIAEGRLIGLYSTGEIKVYSEGAYIAVPIPYIYPKEYPNVYYGLITKPTK